MADRLKVAFMLGSLGRGGTETLVLDTLSRHSDAPFDMLCIRRKDGPYLDAYSDTGVPMHKLAPNKGRLVAYLVRLRKLLLNESVNVVHAQQMLDAVYAKLALIGSGVKVCLTFHGYYYGRSRSETILARLSLAMAHRVFFVSAAQRDDYVRRFNLKCARKLAVVHNGIDFEKFTEPQLHSPHSPIRLLMVGSFLKIRNHITVCKFAKLLRDAGVEFLLSFAGRKLDYELETYNECRSFCEREGLMDNVRFLGDCSNVPGLLSESDVFVYDTNTDTFGIAVAEAMASGIPVLVGGVPVMREITENGKFASLFRHADEQSMFNEFMKIVSDYSSFAAAAFGSATEVRSEYSISRHIECLKLEYRKALKLCS